MVQNHWQPYKIFINTFANSEIKQQPRADGKIINRNYFYIDYKQFVDIVKYRIYKMRQNVEEMIKRVQPNYHDKLLNF